VTVEVTSHLEELGYSREESAAAVSSLTTQVSASVESGQMRQNLVLSGSTLHTTTLSDVTVGGYWYSTVIVVPLETIEPTLSPTTTPPVPFAVLGFESNELMMYFLPILVLIILVLLLVCCCWRRSRDSSLKAHTKETVEDDDGNGSDTSEEDVVVVVVERDEGSGSGVRADDPKDDWTGVKKSSFKIPPKFSAQAQANPYYDNSPASFRSYDRSGRFSPADSPGLTRSQSSAQNTPNREQSTFTPQKPKRSKSKANKFRTHFHDGDEEVGMARL